MTQPSIARESARIQRRKTRNKVALGLSIALVATSILLALGGPTGIAARPGFLGTRANLFSDLNLVAQFVLLAGLTFGFFLARRGSITAHQYNQTAWVMVNIVLTIFIMAVAFVEVVIPGLPGDIGKPFILVSVIHASLGLLSILCGVYLILSMNRYLPRKYRVSWWKNLMRITLALYWAVGLIGLALYYVWYMG